VDEAVHVIFAIFVLPEGMTPVMNDEPAPVPAAAVLAPATVAKAEPTGAEVTLATTVKLSVAEAPVGSVTVIGIKEVWFLANSGMVPTETAVGVCPTAFAATVDNPPRPKATTATSATRLNVVFVDIDFLSRKKVEKENFSLSAWPKLPSHR